MEKVRLFVLVYVAILVISAFVVMSPGTTSNIPYQLRATGGSFYIVPVEDFGYAPMLKHLIDNAQTSVCVAMEEMSDNEPVKTILDSLISAYKNRNVDVKVLYEGDVSSNTNAANYLINNGLPASDVNEDGSTKFIHTKLVVIDGQIVYVGSHNWSPNAFGKNNEYGAMIYNKTIATFFQNYFNSLWNNADNTPNINLVHFTTTGYEVNTTYDWHTYYSLDSLMKSANTRLYVAMYTMAYYSNPSNNDEQKVDNLVNDIVAKKSIANVVLDNRSTNDNSYNYLSSQGVDVVKDKSYITTHLKLVIADDSVYIGDSNWDTDYINNNTHTVGVVIKNATLADYFASFFLKVYQYGNVPYYIPSPFVNPWQTSGPAGGYATLKIYIANGGYKNSTYFYLKPHGSLWMDIGRYPSWYRTSVYDWRNETLYIEIPSYASGTYTVALTFYSKYHDINYTMYFKVSVSGSGGSVPRTNHPLITEVYYKDGSSYTKYRFVEIYNPTSSDFDLEGYKLVNVSSGKTYTIHGLKILAHSHVTIAVKAYYFAEKFFKYPDIGDGYMHDLEISATQGGIELRKPDNTTVVDAVYWGGYNGWNVNTDLYRSIVRVPYDWDNDSASQWIGSQEPKPWVQATADKVILIDRGHDSYFSSKLGEFVIQMRKLGLNPENFTSGTGYHSNISADRLNTSSRALGKLLLITDPGRALHSQEITNITNFINNFNGSLLLTSESDYKNYSHPQNLNPILQAINSVIRFNDDEVLDSTNNSGGHAYKPIIHHFNDTTGEVATGVSQVEFKSSSSLVDSSYTRLNEDDGAILFATGDDDTSNTDADNNNDAYIYPSGTYIPVAAGQIINKHRLAALGATIFQDGGDGISSTYDNSLFTQNLVKWLMGIKSPSLGTPNLEFVNSQHLNSSVVISVATSHVDSVQINYTTDGTHYTEDSMYDDGTHGDQNAGDGVYSYTMSNYTAGIKIQIKITGTGLGGKAQRDFVYYAMPDISWVRNNTDKTVIIEGRITVKPGSFKNAIYVQDSTAGIEIYGFDLSSLNLNYGDYVKVIGNSYNYSWDMEVKITSEPKVVKTMPGTPVSPQDINIQQANSTNYGKLVRISGTVKYINNTATTPYFYVQDSSGHAVKVYLKNKSIDISTLNVGDSVQVTGVQAQYHSTYEILPREQNDIVVGVVPEFGSFAWIVFVIAFLGTIYAFRKH